MAAESRWPEIDDRPPSHAETFDVSVVGADINLLTRTGKPPKPTCAVEARSTTGGVLVVTMAGGGNASIFIPAGGVSFRRIAAVAVVFASTTADVDVTAYWDANHQKN